MKQTGMAPPHDQPGWSNSRRIAAQVRVRGSEDLGPAAGGKETRLQGTILVGVDFDQSLSNVLDSVLVLAERLSKSIVLLHVVEPFHGRWFVDSSKREMHEAETNRKALQRLEAMVPSPGDMRPPTACIVRNGLPEYEILRAAESLGAHLIVLGRRPRSAVHRWIFGSITHSVIDCASCPVLVVRDIAFPPQKG